MTEFKETFHVETGGKHKDWAPFMDFIKRVRNQLSRKTTRFAHGRLPVLPNGRLPENRNKFFEIVLETKLNKLGLRIRLHDLYLISIQRQKSGPWISLDNTADGTGLGYGGGYDSLQTNWGTNRQNIEVGQQRLVTAVNNLATITTRGQMGSDVRARELIVVIEMIFESIRFNRISKYFAFGVDPEDARYDPRNSPVVNERSFTPPPWMQKLQNSWNPLSRMLLEAGTNPMYCVPSHVLPRELADIKTVDHLVRTLGVLQHHDVPVAPKNKVGKSGPIHHRG